MKFDRIVVAPRAYNALTAKMVELVGFDAVYVMDAVGVLWFFILILVITMC